MTLTEMYLFLFYFINIRIKSKSVDICNRINATQHIICIYCYIRRYFGFWTLRMSTTYYVVFGGYQAKYILNLYTIRSITLLCCQTVILMHSANCVMQECLKLTNDFKKHSCMLRIDAFLFIVVIWIPFPCEIWYLFMYHKKASIEKWTNKTAQCLKNVR